MFDLHLFDVVVDPEQGEFAVILCGLDLGWWQGALFYIRKGAEGWDFDVLFSRSLVEFFG